MSSVNIPKRGHTQEDTNDSRLDTDFEKGVSSVNIAEERETTVRLDGSKSYYRNLNPTTPHRNKSDSK